MPAWDDPRALARYRNWLYLFIVMGLLVAAGRYVLQSSLPVRQVVVTGKLSKVSNEQLQFVIKHKISGNALTLELNQIQQEFERLAWVKQADVKRLWPDRLEVVITERVALARWSAGGLIDENGVWFDAYTDEVLPVFDAPQGTEKQIAQMYRQLQPMLNNMGERLKVIQLSDRNAWQLTLQNDLTIRLGRKETMNRLQRTEKVWKKYLKAQENDIEYIDLRYPDGFALKLRKSVIQEQ